MNWSKIGKTIGSAAPLVGGLLGGPLGGVAGSLVASALGVDASPHAVDNALSSDPAALARIRELEITHATELRRMAIEAETTRLVEVNRTMQAEAQSCDPYVRRWRPTFGYAVAGTWILQTVAFVAVTVYAPFANPETGAALVNAVGDALAGLGTQWAVALAVLGVNVASRTKDKMVQSGHRPKSVIEMLFDKGGTDGRD